MPATLIKPKLAALICIYVCLIRTEITEKMDHRDFLFVHPLSGQPLLGPHLTSIVKKVFSRSGMKNAEFVTPMHIRHAWASYCYQRWWNKEGFLGLSEDEFLQQLGKQLNTSVEQLRRTYLSHNLETSIGAIQQFLNNGNISLEEAEDNLNF